MTYFLSFHGTVTAIHNFTNGQQEENDCNHMFTVENNLGQIVNFIVSPSTYFLDLEMVTVGDQVTGYYDGDAPAILIYPPQYPALVMVKDSPSRHVKVDYFNNQLISSDSQLQLNISPHTRIVLTNGQLFTKNLANRDLIVEYGPTTHSIPAQTTPSRIIVLC